MDPIVNREELDAAAPYRKDPEEENFLSRFNSILAPHEEDDYRDLPQRYPTLYVVAGARSGTTLLSQVVASCLDVGYVNNLIAAFWRAPVYGIRLSKKLLPRLDVRSFHSEFGRTETIHEPHEFGYFWRSVLGYDAKFQRDEALEDKTDWIRLRSVVVNMAHAFGRPLTFKSPLYVWHIARLQALMPKSCFVWIRRDPVQTALSLLGMRKSLLGSVEAWASLKPLEYAWLKDEPYWTQVAGQVYFVERAIQEQINRIDGRNVLTVSYEDFVQRPKAILTEIRELLGRNGFRPQLVAEPPASFSHRTRTRQDSEDYDRVAEALQRFYRTKAA